MNIEEKIRRQINKTKENLKEDAFVVDGLREMTELIFLFFNYLEAKAMDKKMHQVTKKMQTAEKDVKRGQPKKAVQALKKAEKKNEKLVKIDREIRDPLIEKCKKNMKGKK